ncbi:transposase [Bradyrhizobium canariense]|uniref:transposase n=1 Tax=Bradyrhizobium canariense TaxID=255045 RepID=UPI001F0A48C4|nr:transposase [Bradyrhizobium canariense]
MSVIARSHGLDPSQLFASRRKALGSGLVAPGSGARGQAVNFARFDAVTSDMVTMRAKARQEKSAAIARGRCVWMWHSDRLVAGLFDLWDKELPRLSGKSKLVAG